MITKYKLFLESRQTENIALKILERPEVIEVLKELDNSKNQILLPIMAYFYEKDTSIKDIEQTFIKIPKLLNKNLISLVYTKKGIKVIENNFSLEIMIDKIKRFLEDLN